MDECKPLVAEWSSAGTVKLRTPAGGGSARGAVAATVAVATGRVVMEIGGGGGDGRRGSRSAEPDVYFSGCLGSEAGTG